MVENVIWFGSRYQGKAPRAVGEQRVTLIYARDAVGREIAGLDVIERPNGSFELANLTVHEDFYAGIEPALVVVAVGAAAPSVTCRTSIEYFGQITARDLGFLEGALPPRSRRPLTMAFERWLKSGEFDPRGGAMVLRLDASCFENVSSLLLA